MRFRMLKSAAGPMGSFQPGEVRSSPPVDERLARAFVESGSAEWLPEPDPKPEPWGVTETAEAAPAPETAAERTEKPKRGRKPRS